MNGLSVSNGQPPPDDEHEKPDEPDGHPEDKAGGSMSGELDFGADKVHFRASFRSWIMIAGVVALGFLSAVLKLAHAVIELIGHNKK